MNQHIYINPDWYKGYLITSGEKNLGLQFFETIEEAEEYVQYVNNMLIEIGERPFEGYKIEYKDLSSEVGLELIKELRKFI